MKKIISLIALLIFSFSVSAFSQIVPKTTSSKKAIRFFMDAQDYFNGRDAERALDAVGRAVSEDPQFVEGWLLQGELQLETGNEEGALVSFRRASMILPDFFPPVYYRCAVLELSSGKYTDAKNDLQRFMQYKNVPADLVKKAGEALKSAAYGEYMVAHPVPFDPVNMGDSINSPNDEYVNAITGDEQRFYFTRVVPVNPQMNSGREEDFYFSDKCDTTWCRAVDLGPPINTSGNEGAIFISPDGQYIFFAACNREDGYGSCDIYGAVKQGNSWSVPKNLGPVVNGQSWDSQPSFSSDGKTLYFASKRGGGKGSSDIWKTELQPDGSWSQPQNLGDSVNTDKAEMAPFIHPDDQTLYFSSSGHQGMGGQDLFISRRNPDGSWGKVVNLGYPINTSSDEITLIVKPKGDIAYVSSDKFGGRGKQDIYWFPLYYEARPLQTTYFKGIVFDKTTKEKLQANFELTDLSNGGVVARSFSDPVSGEFLLSLPTGKDYALNVSKKGYLFYSDNFALRGTNTSAKPFIKNIPLQKIQSGEKVILRNIFFDTDKYVLKPESVSELDKLTDLLIKNPSLQIEISGHTDNQGSAEYNLALSGNRARAVYQYLISKGIDAGRLSYKGYGLSQPVDTNSTEEGRANNRRTEFRVK